MTIDLMHTVAASSAHSYASRIDVVKLSLLSPTHLTDIAPARRRCRPEFVVVSECAWFSCWSLRDARCGSSPRLVSGKKSNASRYAVPHACDLLSPHDHNSSRVRLTSRDIQVIEHLRSTRSRHSLLGEDAGSCGGHECVDPEAAVVALLRCSDTGGPSERQFGRKAQLSNITAAKT